MQVRLQANVLAPFDGREMSEPHIKFSLKPATPDISIKLLLVLFSVHSNRLTGILPNFSGMCTGDFEVDFKSPKEFKNIY